MLWVYGHDKYFSLLVPVSTLDVSICGSWLVGVQDGGVNSWYNISYIHLHHLGQQPGMGDIRFIFCQILWWIVNHPIV